MFGVIFKRSKERGRPRSIATPRTSDAAAAKKHPNRAVSPKFQQNLKSWAGLSNLPLSIRLFIGFFLSLAGLCYVTLLGSIWYDTQWSLAAITEGYGSMENIELFHHSFKHLFWFFGIFGFALFLFLLTNASENIKQWMMVSVPVVIVADIGSAWLVRYHNAFSYVMFASGVFLSICFLGIYIRVQSELWLSSKKQSQSS